MCYRYTLTDLLAVRAMFAAAGFDPDLELPVPALRHNVAVTSLMPVIIRQTKPAGAAMRFGIIRPATKTTDKTLLLVNARAETLLDNSAFRDAARHRRCLVPADGFFEWEKQGRTRLPHYFTLKSGGAFFFAGIWEPATDTTPAAFAIVTTTPNALLSPLHDRMPVLLGPNSGPVWLGDEPLEPTHVARLCRPLPADLMAGRRVDPRMNNVRYQAPDCIAPV